MKHTVYEKEENKFKHFLKTINYEKLPLSCCFLIREMSSREFILTLMFILGQNFGRIYLSI